MLHVVVLEGIELNKSEPIQIVRNRIEVNRTKLDRADPMQTEPIRSGAKQTKLNQIELRRRIEASNQIGPERNRIEPHVTVRPNRNKRERSQAN